MSDDLVNQITLNFLISKQQLQKLNKKIKQKEEDKMKTDMEIYKEQFVELFNKMVNDDFPDDLLEDVKHSYTYFVEKSIYYLKMKATINNTPNTIEVHEEQDEDGEQDEEQDGEQDEEQDEDEDEDEDEEQDEDEDEDEDEEQVITINNKSKINPQLKLEVKSNTSTIYKKVKKNTQSKGVDNIEQLPLDWFTKVRQTQKQHNIIPRKNDDKK
jgi:hypothetical protein